ncbi:DUF4199 domain-containing protein [Fulvivirga sedimenti]|uniref:DUF4199 domain-containing protein n=1 Tax=Fulvivirga sedimenti TaxID=2879465 RepID=A0A9X1HWF7_9BACT|nr:DUF4199 domain-containing protein [Fulvivirga sedimenti]MCA6078640.1 DUF4199 domain-containing protein [Fulvivirga sedimenti]
MDNTIENNAIKYGLLTSFALIGFFFLMKVMGLSTEYELRALNVLFLFSGVYFAVKSYIDKADNVNYLGGLGTGMLTSGIALFVFSGFIVIYLGVIDPSFMNSLKEYEYFGRYLNPYIAGAVIFLEGTISGLLVSFILMQYYKRSHLSTTEPAIP